ncbi:MAG: MraY family glycosyltransferase [Candidatus Krumholzibacteria bacterium]|nr:MraY family glycosyltransferase [Candidatus Krumholzibacteria bacterium]
MALLNILVPLAVALLTGLLLVPLVIGMAVRWRVCEKPNGRTSREIAHIGGIAIFGAVLLSLVTVFLFVLHEHPLSRTFLPVLITSGIFTFLLGLIDDLRSLHYLYKLFLQIAVAGGVAAGGLALGAHFGHLALPFPASIVAFAVASAWILGATTSFNLIDGIDGLAAGIALVASASFAIAGIALDLTLVTALSAALFGASLAFLRFNFPPARIFMGDSGSLFIGLIFALVSLLVVFGGGGTLHRAGGSVLVLAVPLLDTTLAFFRRLLSGRKPFEADHMHLHHLLLFRFGSARRADAVLWSVSAVFSALGVLSMLGSTIALVAGVVLAVSFFAVALRRMVRFTIDRRRAERILSECGVSSTSMAVHTD